MVTTEQSVPANHYPAINLSGNARAIIGNVYGIDNEFVRSTGQIEQRPPCLKSLQVQSKQEQDGLASISGGLPVLLLQDYEDVRLSINALRTFDQEIEKCAKHIGVRQAIFQQSLKELLDPSVGPDAAQQMLCNSQHPTWADEIFRQHLQDRLGTNLAAAQLAFDLISLSLEGLMWFGKRCALLQEQTKQVSIVSPRPPSQANIVTHKSASPADLITACVAHSIQRHPVATVARVDLLIWYEANVGRKHMIHLASSRGSA